MTMDHWLYGTAKNDDSMLKDNNNTDDHSQLETRRYVQEMTPPAETDMTVPWKQRLKTLKDLYFYADTMLLHKRYLDDDSYKHQSRSVSLEICHRAAVRAVSLASELSVQALDSLSTCPVTLYSLVMALRLLGCIFSRRNSQQGSMEAEAELLFEKGYHTLHQLPIFQNPQSMMYDTLCQLWDFYNKYSAAKDQRQLSGEALLKKPVINSAWACDFNHPFNAFLDSGGASSFIHQLLSISANSTPALSSSMAIDHIDETVCGGSARQHSQLAQQPKIASTSDHSNTIDPVTVTLDDTLFSPQNHNDQQQQQQHSPWQHDNNSNYHYHSVQPYSLCGYPSSISSIPSSSIAKTTALDSEKAPIADVGFPAFGLPELINSYQQGPWQMPISTSAPNFNSLSTFSSTTSSMNGTGY